MSEPVAPADPEVGEPVDLWARVVGQPGAVAALRAAAVSPTHAYLLVGPPGSGKRAAAEAFAADLLADGRSPEDAVRSHDLVARGRHPSLVLVEREGPWITAEQAREIVRTSAMSPPEGSVQVFVLDEFHLVSDAAPILLKSIEEPPPGTVFVVLADELTDELVTIASRCVRIEFHPVPTATVASVLREEGIDGPSADAAAAASGGDLRRARLLATDPGLAARRTAWASVPERLDGTGATVCALVDGLLGSVEEVLEPLAARQAAEVAALEEAEEMIGSSRKGDHKRLEDRHKREARRIRVEELRGGLSTMMGTYRDALVAGGDPAAFERAGRLVQDLADGLRFNPTEAVQLRALFLQLPRL